MGDPFRNHLYDAAPATPRNRNGDPAQTTDGPETDCGGGSVGSATCTHALYSEVALLLVAVAVIQSPDAAAMLVVKLALPAASVVTETAPRGSRPSPCTEGSHPGQRNSSTVAGMDGRVWRLPVT